MFPRKRRFFPSGGNIHDPFVTAAIHIPLMASLAGNTDSDDEVELPGLPPPSGDHSPLHNGAQCRGDMRFPTAAGPSSPPPPCFSQDPAFDNSKGPLFSGAAAGVQIQRDSMDQETGSKLRRREVSVYASREESVYAPVLLRRLKDYIVEDGKCADSDANADPLTNQFATTGTDHNNHKHSVSAELGTDITTPSTTSSAIVEHVALKTSARSADKTLIAACKDTHTGQGSAIITANADSSHHHSVEREHENVPRDDKQLRPNGSSSEPLVAQNTEGMQVAPDASMVRKRCSLLMMEKGDRSAKKAMVERAGVEISLLNCPICFSPLKPPVFQCNGGHLACGTCLAKLPGGQCPTCEHGGGFGPCHVMDGIVSSAGKECPHDGCQSYVTYHDLDDHRSACPHAPCFCTEPGCGFAGSPPALLRHLADLHSWPVHNIEYDKALRLQVPVSEPRRLLLAEEGGRVFLLAVGALSAVTAVSVVCIRAGDSPRPQYLAAMRAYGPPAPSTAAGVICMVHTDAVMSSTRPGEVAVEKLPFILLVPPTHVFGDGASKEVSLKIRIDKM